MKEDECSLVCLLADVKEAVYKYLGVDRLLVTAMPPLSELQGSEQ